MPDNSSKNKIGPNQGNTFSEILFLIGIFVLNIGYFIFHGSRALMITTTAFGLATGFLFVFRKVTHTQIKVSVHTIWYFVFFIYAELSSLWAIDASRSARYYLVAMILIILFSFVVSQYVDTVSHVEKLLKIYIFSTLAISFIELVFTPVSEWTSGYFGSVIGGNNSNSFGYINMMAAIIAFYFAYTKSKKLYYINIFIFLIFCLLTSSRKAIALSIVGIILIVAFSFKKKNHLLHLALLCLFAFLFYIILLEVKFFYDLVGYRFDGLIEYFLDDTDATGTGSLAMRSYFIEFAKILFQEKPISGHGMANFSVLLGTESNSNASVYTHNNYWQILADLGIIGFILYYSFYIFLLIKLITKLFKNTDNTIVALALALLISQIIIEWGIVSMATFYSQIVIVFIYVCTYASNSKRKYHYSPISNTR